MSARCSSKYPHALRAFGISSLVCLFASSPTLAVSTHSTAIDLNPDESEVWVVNPDHGTVGIIAATGVDTNTLVAEITVGPEPWSIDFNPAGTEAWVTSMANNAVYIIDTSTRAVIDSVTSLGFETFGVAFNPAGTVAVVTASGSDEVFAVDPVTRTITQTIPVYRRPRGIAWKADGQRVWISHLLMPESIGRLTAIFSDGWTTSSIFINQVFGTDLAGYPSTMQNITLAPPPNDDILWMPNNMINTSAGNNGTTPLTPTNIFHAVIRPVNITTGTDLSTSTYFMSETPGTPVGGPIAVDFSSSRAYIANLHSDNVTVTNNNVLIPVEIAVIPVGSAPIGIVTHSSLPRVYTANWLTRDVSVIGTGGNTVVATVPSSFFEPLLSNVLNGKKFFFTSTGDMSLDGRGACASCHVFATADARPWDLSQFGKRFRSTPDIRGIAFTGPHDWTADKDEMQDHNFGILEFTGGVGLLPGGGNPPLGAPNAGISQDLDDMGIFMARLTHRSTTPFRNPDGTQTADADSGEVIFNDPTVGCANCHVGPLFTDSSLQENPFLKHDVGTADSADVDAAAGFDTPSLVGLWDTAPYLHHNLATTLQAVFTTFNPTDQHGTTSQLSSQQIDWLAAYLQQIAWPDSTGATDAPVIGAPGARNRLQRIYPNPFEERTSLQFSIEMSPSDVRVDVFDVQGRRVRSLIDRPFTRGSHIVGWDSRDDQGARVAAGTYFARLFVSGQETGSKKMTVLH